MEVELPVVLFVLKSLGEYNINYYFNYDLKIMELGAWDVILGVDCVFQFSPITFDFHQFNIVLHNQGDIVD